MMLRWLPEDITVHNEDLEGSLQKLPMYNLLCFSATWILYTAWTLKIKEF